MSRLFDALNGAADGAFVIDDKLRIVFWNKAAEKILGFKNEDVVGKLCYQLLRGYDNKENLVCNAHCKVAELTSKSEPMPNYDVHMKTKHGDRHWLNMSIFTYKMDKDVGRNVVVHLFRDIKDRKFDDDVLTHLIELIRTHQDAPEGNGSRLNPRVESLTSREYDVLNLLAKGHPTDEIGELLSITPNTVRNHIQHILNKLHVHNRLEAVVYAIEQGLIN
ncbi:MAG TPA: hypothetical protein DCX54_11615 [Flavobacteriales bacterium]|nr:hypothetical protein [Flavobacteriales bacterium]